MYILSTNLLYLMNKNNINKNQLSKIISVGPSVVGKWVNGEITDLKLTSVASIATFFNVTIDDLIFSNIEMQEKLIEKHFDFQYIKVFKWNEKINLVSKNFQKIPSIFIHDNVNSLFIIEYPSEYSGIFSNKSIVLLKKDFTLQINDILLVRNKIINNFLFISYNNVYKDIITNELVDIEQYNIEGVLINIIFDNGLLNL